MADWEQIEKDFTKYNEKELSLYRNLHVRGSATFNWFKTRLQSEYPPAEKLSAEEKDEFYTSNVTAEITPKYGK